MSVVSFVSDDLFSVRVTKYLSTNPANKWANSYEFKATAGGGEEELLALGTALVNFESAFHYDTVIFDRLLISTWAADSVPYDPEAFISTTLTASGGITPTTNQLGLNQVLSVARIAASGRFGHLFYRACVSEEDVTAPAGTTVLVNRTTFQSRISEAITDEGLDEFIGAGVGSTLAMVMINKTGDQVRIVNSLRVQGMSQVPLDHAWFNRTPSA